MVGVSELVTELNVVLVFEDEDVAEINSSEQCLPLQSFEVMAVFEDSEYSADSVVVSNKLVEMLSFVIEEEYSNISDGDICEEDVVTTVTISLEEHRLFSQISVVTVSVDGL